MIDGTADPYLKVEPQAYGFRLLSASNDRFWNLPLYAAKSSRQAWNPYNRDLLDPDAGEVPMLDAVANPDYPSTWPTDMRAGGVPDPAASGPSMMQTGTEGGSLPEPVVLPHQPVNCNFDRRDIVVLNVTGKTLFLGPAERADVIVDFSEYAGQALILYSHAPAPVPAFDPRNDHYTGARDQTDTGGAPPTLPGHGPNTRTLMQTQVGGSRLFVPEVNPTMHFRRFLPDVAANSGSQGPLPTTAQGEAAGEALSGQVVAGPAVGPVPDLAALRAAFRSTATSVGALSASHDPIAVRRPPTTPPITPASAATPS